MPFEGTLDFWVLCFITIMNLMAVYGGLWYAHYGTVPFSGEDVKVGAYPGGALFELSGNRELNLKLIATVFALVEATPGLLFVWYVSFP